MTKVVEKGKQKYAEKNSASEKNILWAKVERRESSIGKKKKKSCMSEK